MIVMPSGPFPPQINESERDNNLRTFCSQSKQLLHTEILSAMQYLGSPVMSRKACVTFGDELMSAYYRESRLPLHAELGTKHM